MPDQTPNDHQDDHQNDGRIAGSRSQKHPKLYGREEEQANIAFLKKKKKKKKKKNYHRFYQKLLWNKWFLCLRICFF